MKEMDALLELVKKAAEGDRTAFDELYRETCRSVYFICLGFLKDEIDAQDVTQEVYLTVFEQLGTLEDKSKFKPWIYRIAANKSINCLKKKQPILPGDDLLDGMETEDNENFLPEEYALSADKRERESYYRESKIRRTQEPYCWQNCPRWKRINFLIQPPKWTEPDLLRQ